MDIRQQHIRTYTIVALTLLLSSYLLSYSNWIGTIELHTIMEVLSSIIALFVGTLALLRFYSRGGTDYLVIGAGFIGISVLDGYHGAVTSSWLINSSDPAAAWSWLASRLLLSMTVLALYTVLKKESDKNISYDFSPKLIFSTIFISTLCIIIFFTITPFPVSIFSSSFITRPAELIPAVIFFLALLGFLKSNRWKLNNFAHWIMLSIVINLVTQLMIMPFSTAMFDVQFDFSHILKILSYLCILCGLCISFFSAFKDADLQVYKRKKVQLSLEASDIRNKTMMNSLVDSLILINEKGIIENINNSTCKLFGYSKLELLGKNIKTLMPKEYADRHDEILSNYLKTGKASIINYGRKVTGLRKNGSTFPMELSVSEMSLRGKIKYTGIIRDDTDRLRAETEIIKAKEDAQLAANAKSDFLATMSHEIRTPMNGVLGMVELLQDTPLNNKQEDIVRTISDSGKALLEIINDILEYSKVEAGMIQIDKYVFNLERTIYDVTRLLLVKAEEKGIELIFYYHTDCPEYVIGDAGRIRQIILNLVGNAVKFTNTGQVMVEVKYTHDTDDYNICIEVVDTGIGIEEKIIEKLFESFTQADNSTSRKYGGTGLGLTISKRLVELMDGYIDVESEPGKGSKFWFELTLEIAEAPEKIERLDLDNVHVLIIDDNPVTLRILSEQLKKFNMRVEETLIPKQAIALMRAAIQSGDEHKLVIIDNMLPSPCGSKLGQAIIEDEKLKHVPLVLLSSASSMGDAAIFKEIGFSAYLTYPILSELLYKSLTRVLGLVSNNSHDRFLTRYSVIEDESVNKHHSVKLCGNILLVEDVLVNQKVAIGLMSGFDLQIDVANNGEEALEKYNEKKYNEGHYDIILMDCQMPVMDGFEATRKIRQADKEIPIIALTANALSTDRDKCLEAGMSDYLAKPYNKSQLIDIVLKWLGNEEITSSDVAPVRSDINVENDIINYTALANMKKAIGPVFDELIPAYIKQSDGMINNLLTLFHDNDMATIERYAHSMKSSSLNVAAEKVSDNALVLEEMSRNDQNNPDIKLKIEQLIEQYTQARVALLKYQNRGN